MLDKGKEVHGLMKVPDSVLLKNALTEIGKLKSYIEELEDKLKCKSEIKKGSIESLTQANAYLKNKNKELTKLLYDKK